MNKVFCFVILVVLIGFLFENIKTIETYSAGTDIQLLTSKPYYTWYDYYTQMARYPYEYSYGYPRYYGYGSQYGYPYYQPTFLPYYF